MTATAADLVLNRGLLLTVDAENRVIPDGAVAVRDGRIAAVGTTAELSGLPAAEVIDARGGIIMPGLVNTHTHAAMTLFRGLADDLPLMAWLNEHIFPAEAGLDAEQVRSGALLACAEMILSGTTTFCDMYLFAAAVGRAAQQAGMRAVVGEVLFDFPSPAYGDAENGFACTQRLIDAFRGDPLISVAVEPHSPYLCRPELLERAFRLAQRHGLPMVIHLAETSGEVETIIARYGRTPVGHLAALGLLAPNVLACHCVALTEDDIGLLQAHAVKVSHNPESNMKLASGIAPVPRLLAAGICVGLGTDGAASNNNLDLFQEMDTAAKLHKGQTLDPTVMDAQTVLRMATIDGARALGLGERIGSIEAGKQADLIVLDTRKPHLTPMYHPASHLVYAARGSDVATVVIAGRVVLRDRRILTFDAQAAMDEVNRLAAAIRARK
ncbi:MAG: amidohydrolase [Desulfobacterales bacterium]|jgi:5-methylthioadenosine/S-adenosylhomocysteine deaminase|nr:amidohydrolase [Desulfobacterales bacterium]